MQKSHARSHFGFRYCRYHSVAVISLLQMTIDKGWLYMILLYSNLINLFLYFWGDLDEYYLNIFFLPTALLSFQIGVEVCFYDGMSTMDSNLFFQHTSSCSCFFAHCWHVASRGSARNCISPVKTFATLMILCYISILGTCVEIIIYWEL